MTNLEGEKGGKIERKKFKEDKQPTKVVVRHLPPTMTLESFLEQVDVPPHDYICYGAPDKTLMPHCTSRVYINFLDIEDLLIFTQKFDGYVFLDNKGHEYQAVVEFAPFQRIAKPKTNSSKKKNTKCGTIESDPYFIEFKENLLEEREKAGSRSFKQHYFETNTDNEAKNKITDTPLLQYLRNKNAEKAKSREDKREERKRKEAERKKMREEQQNLRRAQARKQEQEAQHSNIVYGGGPYGNKRDAFSRRKSDDRSKPVRDKDIPGKNPDAPKSKAPPPKPPAGHPNEKPWKSQDAKDLKAGKKDETPPVAAPFKDPAIIEMRVAPTPKANNRYNRQGSNSGQPEKRNRYKEEKKANNTPNNTESKNRKERTNADGRNRDRYSRTKPDNDNKAKDDNSRVEHKPKSNDTKGKPYPESPSKNIAKSSPNKSKVGETKPVPEKLDDKNSKVDKSNKFSDKKADPKGSSKPEGKSNEELKSNDKELKSNDKDLKSSEKKDSNVSDKDKADVKAPSVEKKRGSLELELSHNVLQRRKSLEGKQPEKYVESGRRNSLDLGEKNNHGEDGRDARTERRIRNKDRPSIAIYRPGMGKFSKQRIKDKSGGGTDPDSVSHSHSPSPTNMSKVPS
ncbi:hypothetical protein M8J75_007301 [Diaphorina citri]|nr:hypothetical protein M8J75_007301 [Diaphorina citri]KAI5754418.1 hypothetical protein M8J77_008487 [Diaphorina citri]